MMLDLVKYPVIRTEKATRLIENNQFSFDIDMRFTKPQIKKIKRSRHFHALLFAQCCA